MDNLIQELVISLAPALPYLTTVGQKISEEIGQTLGKAVTEKAKKIWEILHYRIELNPPAVEATKKLAVSPDDENARKNLGIALRKILETNDDLTKQLLNLFQIEESRFQQQTYNYAPIEKQVIIQKVDKIEL